MSDPERKIEDNASGRSSVDTAQSDGLQLGRLPQEHQVAHPVPSVQRRLQQRHIQMIAIAGTIGTGLFLGSGLALRTAGPLGALIAYILVGSVAYASLCSLCEMTTWAPISGTFPHFAERWVDPALGFAVGWNFFYSSAISTAVEITAAVILMTFWDKNTNHAAIYTAVFFFLILVINLFGVRWFGEAEFAFSTIKILLIIGFLIAGLVIDLGGGPQGDRIGFRYWMQPGKFARAGLVHNIHIDKFLGVLSVLVQAAFSFQGMELFAIAASETESPRRNIPKAMRRVFYRILFFYILGIIMVGMLVAYNNPALVQNTGTAAQSPFVIAMNHAGITGLPHVINAAILISAFSAGNSFLFCASRILYGLAIRGQAPQFLASCTDHGLPRNAVLAASTLGLLSFVNVKSGAETVFNWLVYLITTTGFFSSFTTNLTYIYFYQGMQAQERDLSENAYSNRLQPYLAYWGCSWTLIFIFINGLTVFFGKFKTSIFIASYINIPIFLCLYSGYKFVKGTKVWTPLERDLVTDIPDRDQTELREVPPANIWESIARIIF
ncbi:hypothetical protein K443DRAFT_14080 [Laccaria amethystina LaAM-08-1]|uniref:Amino acid permease/ SLC12A domain-containing protein n=1 Tax=Laccaria amethystina LaAM-08-1 TaxID=1095629 RepID=A0A0C9X2F0_9AGAR|nr:hypothetical protein K443DRAFT_14080 [Laccaria amethystina LaAM-08-1]